MATNDATDLLEDCPYSEAIEEAFMQGGVKAVNTYVSQQLDEWKNNTINVGVLGNSGVGKSSFINAIRGLSAGDDGAAEVGVVETTTELKPYEHPNNEKMLLWDMPGVGTPTFTRDTYLDAIDVNRYDYFMIISACRFTENDQWLGEELKKRNKKFYFIRTKIDDDIRNDKRNHPRTHTKENVIDTVRDDCKKHLGNTVDEVYIINNYENNAHDFSRLDDRLVIDAPELKREALLFTLGCQSESMVLAKKKALMKRIPLMAAISTLGAIIPIPGVGIVVDIVVIEKEIKFYQQQFGLSDEAKVVNAEPSEKIQKTSKVVCNLVQLASNGIAAYMLKLGSQKMALKVVAIAFPFIGTIVNGAASFAFCAYTLKSLLEMACHDALEQIKSCM